MNTIQRGIAQLLKSAVTGVAETLPEDFCLTDARELIERHKILMAAYEGAVRCGIPAEDPAMLPMRRAGYAQTIRSEKQQRLVERIFAVFEENGIDYMPVKGCNLKQLYPKPALRAMGDADILIHPADYPKIRPLMQGLGLAEEGENDHVYPWRAAGVMLIELHKSLLAPKNKSFWSYYGDGWRLAVRGQGHRHDLTPEDTYVFLFVHFAKHYRSSGIGCRHVLDLYVYRRANPGLDWAYIRGELEKLGLLIFHANMERTLAVWFDRGPEDGITQLITEYIFHCGNWGDMVNWTIHRQVRKNQKSGTDRHSRFRALWDAAFPPLEYMSGRFLVLKKWPVLLPVFWAVRIVEVVLFRREHIRRRSGHIHAITDRRVEESRQALELVGLGCIQDAE